MADEPFVLPDAEADASGGGRRPASCCSSSSSGTNRYLFELRATAASNAASSAKCSKSSGASQRFDPRLDARARRARVGESREPRKRRTPR